MCFLSGGLLRSLVFERDSLATPAAVDRALSPFQAATVSRRQLGTDEQGEHLGHAGWARDPRGVVRAVAQWLTESF